MKTDPTVEFTPCGLLTVLNDQMPILYCSVTDKTKEKLAGAFITYLSTNSEDVSQ